MTMKAKKTQKKPKAQTEPAKPRSVQRIVLPSTFQLRMANGLNLQINRIGYPDEGIRFTVFQGMPFNCHFEVQLTRRDAEQVIAILQQELADRRSNNLRE
jgi:hypothetical protein